MGGNPEREPPFFFMKPADSAFSATEFGENKHTWKKWVLINNQTITDTKIPYPTSCSNFHYECELVVAIGEGGTNIPVEDALKWAAQKKLSYISPVFIWLRFLESYLIFRHVYGYSVGVDLTRRDLQNEVSESGIMENWIFKMRFNIF